MMEDYRVLFRMRIDHEYFAGETNGCMGVRICEESLALLRNRQLMFKQMAGNEWVLIGNVAGNGVNEGSDRIGFEFVLKDAGFLYYTEWEHYDAADFYELDLSDGGGGMNVSDVVKTVPGQKRKAGVFFNGKLLLAERLYADAREGGCSEACLRFASREMFWEYWLIARKRDHQRLKLSLEEQSGGLLFSEPEFFNTDLVDGLVWRCVSAKAVKMKDRYRYRLDLSEIIRENPELRRKIVKNIEYPVPGQFHDLKGNYLRRLVYL